MKASPAVRRQRRWRRLLILLLLVTIPALIVALSYALRAHQYDLTQLDRMPQRAEVLDREGRLIGTLPGDNRIVISHHQISPKLVRAILAREDTNFRQHQGIDPYGIARAFVTNIRRRSLAQGASTLTMQLARNTWPLGGEHPLQELDRKVLELFLALRIENHQSKEQIFQHYANRIYLGEGCYGVEAASQHYFNKSAQDLNWTEAAAIAGLIRAPSELNPIKNPEANRAEREQVLSRLQELQWIDPSQAQQALERPLSIAKTSSHNPQNFWLLDTTRRQLEQILSDDEIDTIQRVHTTFDLAWQQRAETQLRQALERIQQSQGYRNQHPQNPPLQAAAAIVNNHNGSILVLVGGADPNQSQFHRATQMRRQVGSTIKPFVYANAFARGLSPRQPISDAPLSNDPLSGRQITDPDSWDPENSDQSNMGLIPARDGLILSRNTVTVRVGRQGTRPPFDQLLSQIQLDPQPAGDSAYLGAGQASPLQLASAYTSFANQGIYNPAWCLQSVLDHDQRSLFRAKSGPVRVLAPNVAAAIDEMLHENTQRGTASPLRQHPQRLAGKTGTTNNNHDTWFVGYTDRYSLCVWVGLDQPAPITPQAYGSNTALPIWQSLLPLHPQSSQPR